MSIFHVEKRFHRFEDVSPAFLQKEGIKLLMCDLDNTLRLHSEKQPTSELVDWIKACRQAGIMVVIVSNNGRKRMMQKFCEPIDVPCVWWAKKPMSTKLTETMKKYNFTPSETAMLGDKITTDVVAANFAKVKAYKVKHRRSVV